MDVFSCPAPSVRLPIRGPVYSPAARADLVAGRPATATLPDLAFLLGAQPDLSYTLCIQSSTATGVDGRDSLPGHSNLAIYINDDSRLMSDPMLQTLGKWPDQDEGILGRILDNVLPDGDASDVLLNAAGDAPTPEHYPFAYCQPIVADGYHALMDTAESSGDYQLLSDACVQFAVEGFNTGTATTSFENRSIIAHPSDIGAQIRELNGSERREPNLLGTIWNTVSDAASSAWDTVSGWASSAWSGLTSWF